MFKNRLVKFFKDIANYLSYTKKDFVYIFRKIKKYNYATIAKILQFYNNLYSKTTYKYKVYESKVLIDLKFLKNKYPNTLLEYIQEKSLLKNRILQSKLSYKAMLIVGCKKC